MPRAEPSLDLCVIGASEAGLAACLGAVALGLSCALVDDGDSSGLTNPDLALALLAQAAADPGRHDSAWAAVAAGLAQAAAERRHARFGALNVRLLRGTGRFLDAATLGVRDHTIRARRFFLATGGTQPAWRLADGLAKGVRLSVKALCHLAATPRDILVVGGGTEAVSAAQSLARLGSTVTLAAPSLLPGLDPELVAPLARQLRRDGVVLIPGFLQMVRPATDGFVATISDGTTVGGRALLLAEHPRPALEALDLSRAGVVVRADRIVLDRALRTSNSRIFAVGHAAGARSTAEGVAQVGYALRAAFLPVSGRLRPEIVPLVTATRPQIATVGQADIPRDAQVWRWPLGQTAGAGVSGEIKIVTDRRGRILQAGLVGSEVRELVPLWTLAIARGLTLAQLAAVPMPVPSLSEAIRAVATQPLARRLRSPWVKRALQAARWLR